MDILSDFDQCLLDIGEHGGQTWIPMSEASHQALLAAEKVHQAEGQLTGITTGLRDLDRRLGGLHGGDLIVIAGRPGMAKTALAVNIAFAAAKEAKKRPYIFSLEMSALDIAARIMAKDSGISSEKQRIGPIDKHEIHLLFDSQLRIANLPIAIDDGMAVSVAQIRARARAYKRRHGLDMMIVDYLQLMHSDRRRGGENRVQEISEMTRALKTMAVELGFRSFSSRN
ncbi:MAG: AAA family ATPase [Deltaproteobacteria bacterium]|nr:AAA family ATPase [Deltaproteobacteria bacterium]